MTITRAVARPRGVEPLQLLRRLDAVRTDVRDTVRTGGLPAAVATLVLAALLTAVLVPVGAWLGIDAQGHALVAALAVLPAALALSLHARISDDAGVAWLATALAALGAACALVAAAGLAVPGLGTGPGLPTVLGPALALVVAASVRRHVAPLEPVRVGLLLGLAGAVGVVLLDAALADLTAPPAAALVAAALSATAVAWGAFRLVRDVAGARAVVGVAAAGGAVLALADAVAHSGVALAEPTLVVARTLAVAVLGAAAARLLRSSVAETTGQLGSLHHRLHHLESAARGDRQRLHELGSTLAGITSASQVIRSGAPLPTQRRERLEEMVEAELQRALRLLAPERGTLAATPLDAVLAPLVLSHQTRGRDVRWTPTGALVLAAPDDVREVVNVLLENAFRHGLGPAVVETTVVPPGGDGGAASVEVTVTDHGPGLAPGVRERLFAWGGRAEASPGLGIGLHAARQVAERNGGHLDLVEAADAGDADGPGCTFRLRLARAGGAA